MPKTTPKRTPEQIYRYNRTAYCKAKFGMTPEEYEHRLSQVDRCEICHDPFDDTLRPNLDHNHVTKQVRGVLCGRCNKGIGLLQDDPNILQSAIKYLNDKGNYSRRARKAPQGDPQAAAQ